jgi:hypothetical protein
VGLFDSQGATALFRAGYHGGTWTTFSSFWGFFFSVSGETVQMVSPGPLGGQVGCGTDAAGTICTWFDNDTVGDLTGAAGMNQSQVASLLLAIRSSIEHPG